MQSSVAEKPRWWLWPTILSLDAPVVVVLWQWLIAASASTRVGFPEAAVLGSSVWLAYAADRWIEGWRLVPENIQTHRHQFHHRWRWPIAAAWAVVFFADVTLAVRGLTPGEFRAGLLILVPVAAYLLSHQLVHRNSPWRAPKELCVAVLLGAGAAAFTASRPGVRIEAMAAPLGLFVLLCFTNCALISVWEDEVDRIHGQTSLALQFARAPVLCRALPWAISLASGAAWLLGAEGRAAACAAASGILLGLVDLAEARTGRIAARVLADVALLTPLAPLILGARA